jgi:hypothetical protein
MVSPSERNGLTAAYLVTFDEEDFDDIKLTIFGKRRILKILAEAKAIAI